MNGGGEGRFPAAMRLKKRSDFKRVYRGGVARKGTHFTLQILLKKGSGRLGIVIPRGWGTAVQRNRIKRYLREAFRQHSAVFSGADTIVQPQPGCKGMSAEEIARCLIEEFKIAVRDGGGKWRRRHFF